VLKKYIAYGFFYLMTSSIVYAGGFSFPSHVALETIFYSDSDDIDIRHGTLAYQTGNDIFNAKHAKETVGKTTVGLQVQHSLIQQVIKNDYLADTIDVTLSRKISDKLSIAASLGQGRIKNKQTKRNAQLTTYAVKAKLTLNKQVKLHIKQSTGFVFDDALIEDDNAQTLSGDITNIDLYWRPLEKIRVEGNGLYRSLSDNNHSQQLLGAVLYGISPNWPWLWVGVSAEKLSYDKTKLSYWTPNDYVSYGVVIDSSFPVNEHFSISLGGNLNTSKEDNNASGTGYSLSAGAYWMVRKNINIKLNGYLLESTQETSNWKQDQLNLSIAIKS